MLSRVWRSRTLALCKSETNPINSEGSPSGLNGVTFLARWILIVFFIFFSFLLFCFAFGEIFEGCSKLCEGEEEFLLNLFAFLGSVFECQEDGESVLKSVELFYESLCLIFFHLFFLSFFLCFLFWGLRPAFCVADFRQNCLYSIIFWEFCQVFCANFCVFCANFWGESGGLSRRRADFVRSGGGWWVVGVPPKLPKTRLNQSKPFKTR